MKIIPAKRLIRYSGKDDLEIEGKLRIGDDGAQIQKVLTGTATIGIVSAVAAAVTNIGTITVTGAVQGDVVALGIDTLQPANLSFTAEVSAASTVRVRATNPTAAAISTVSAIYRVTVIKH